MTKLAIEPLELEARDSAKAARLRYVTDTTVGLGRKRKGKAFSYFDAAGRTVKNAKVLTRIKSLAIPPAWQQVWICPAENGHLQAVGFDARGRKQYRYHPAWQQVRNEQKYNKLIEFAYALPKIRARVKRDLALPGLPREKVLAAVVRLLEITRIRVGNDEYAKTNDTFGLTTMHNKHVSVKGSKISFDFNGKHSIKHEIDVESSQLAQVVRKCLELPGHELFEYLDEQGNVHDVKSGDVNNYLHGIAGQMFSAKDFRTWAGTVAAAFELNSCEPCTSQTAAKRVVNQAIAKVADRLGNTKAICRKSYIHPVVIAAYLEATLHDTLHPKQKHRAKVKLPAHEAAVLRLLEAHRDQVGATKVTVKVAGRAS